MASITGPSIKRNYLYNTLYQILTLIVPLITTPYISRVLGADKIGIYSFTNSIVTYFVLCAALGTASYGQREIAMHRDNKYISSKLFWEIETVAVISTMFFTFLWLIFCISSKEYSHIYFLQTLNIIAVAFDISWYFGGFEEFKLIVLRNSIVKIIGVILLFFLIKTPNDLLLYIGLLASTGLLGNISMWTYLPKRLKKISYKDLAPIPHCKKTFAYFIPTIATSIYTVLDKTMIGAITKSEAENGYYEQATKIVKMTQAMLFSLNTVMSSRMSYLFSENKINEVREKIYKSFDYIFALSIPVFVGLIGISEKFVPWFFGDGYDSVVLLICFMSPLPFVVSVSNILGSQYLTPSGQRVRSSKGIILGAIVNLFMNLILIPFYGAVGATIASVIAETIISITYIRMSSDIIKARMLLRYIWKRFLAAFVMLVVVIIIGCTVNISGMLVTLLQIFVGMIIYGLVLILMKDKLVFDIIRTVKNIKEK